MVAGANPLINRETLLWKRLRQARLLLLFGALAVAGCADIWPVYGLGEGPMVSTYEENMARGRGRLVAGQYGLAVAAFRDAIKRDPNSVEALNGLAAAYDHIGRQDLATYHYARALILDPNSAQTLNNMGFSYMMQGKFDLATVYLRDAQRRDQGDPAIAANRAIAEAALRASQPRPNVQWHAPSDKDVEPLPRAWLQRTTPVVQTLVTQPNLSLASAKMVERLPPQRSAGRADADTLPDMRAAPINDTRMSADHDRLLGPIAASMVDAWAVKLPAIGSGDENDKPPG